MKIDGFVNEFMYAANEGVRIYFAPLVAAFGAIKAELTSYGGTQAFMKSSVGISVKPARKRKR